VETVRRWTDAGGHWRVLSAGGDRVTVALLRCDGGEEVDRVTSSDPALVAYLDGRESSAD
jgi:hypothetical protein